MVGDVRLNDFVAVALLLAIGALFPVAVQAEETAFRFTSTPGSWIGHGYLTYEVTPATGWSFSAATTANHHYVKLSARSLDPKAPLSNYYWDLDLEALGNNALTPGYYPNATRYPFNPDTNPGMWLSGNHRGDNQITGYFTVLEADFGPGATVNHFSVDFRQYDEGSPLQWVDGHFQFNATTPEPAATGVVAVAWALMRRHRANRAGCRAVV
jgi:hypothetical protein